MEIIDLKLHHIERKMRVLAALKRIAEGSTSDTVTTVAQLENELKFHEDAVVFLDSMAAKMTGAVVRNPEMVRVVNNGRRRKDTDSNLG